MDGQQGIIRACKGKGSTPPASPNRAPHLRGVRRVGSNDLRLVNLWKKVMKKFFDCTIKLVHYMYK